MHTHDYVPHKLKAEDQENRPYNKGGANPMRRRRNDDPLLSRSYSNRRMVINPELPAEKKHTQETTHLPTQNHRAHGSQPQALHPKSYGSKKVMRNTAHKSERDDANAQLTEHQEDTLQIVLQLASACPKHRYGSLTVNMRVSREDPDRLSGCSACSPGNLVDETVDHVFQCSCSARHSAIL
jgi:hypothetical protein